MTAKKTAAKRKPKKRAASKKTATKRKTKKRVERKAPVRKTTAAARKAGKKVAPKKRAVGRPTKYSKALAEKLPAMFDNGESVVEVCVALDIHKDTFYEWVKLYPEFSDAYKKGLAKSEAWWTRLGRGGAMGQVKIQPATWVFNMKNRFNWKDRIENQHSGQVSGKLVIGGDMDVGEWEAAAKKQQAIMKGGVGE